ncbi:hypothetical protein LTR84_000618 [Exophiala bonariae]|uniref:Sfi1 spindle body domain-containing protein n=1 Tax=Exophiala bonariae TaxID=1690606 RepID=A0AAV9NR23_9EURO|nr:hypothetical protein LTR84_000618 [Exophiala bonariae]
MKPEELSDFAHDIRNFSPADIDRLHRVLLRLQEDHIESTPESLRREHKAVYLEEGQNPNVEDPCLNWLLDLARTESETPLNEKFLDVLQEAHIVLTTDGTLTDGGSEYGASRRAASVEVIPPFPTRPQSSDSFDDNNRIWLQAVALDSRKLASQALDQWRQKLYLKREDALERENPELNRLADEVYRTNLARKAITHWRNTIKEMQDLERVAVEFRAKRDAASVLKTWTLAARERLFVRVRDERLLHKTLEDWHNKTADIKEMEVAADAISIRQAAQNVLQVVATRRADLRERHQEADHLYGRNIIRRVLSTWHTHVEQQRVNDRRAMAAVEYFSSKHTLQTWREKTRIRADEKHAQQAHEQMLAVKYFRRWQALVKSSKEATYSAAYKSMRRKVKINIGRAALNTWRQKTIRIREMRIMSDEFRARKKIEHTGRVAHSAIMVMFNKAEQVQDLTRQADAFGNKHAIARLEIFGSKWLSPTRKILEDQRKADEYHTIKTDGYSLSRLRNWRNLTFRTSRLENDADGLFRRNEKKRALGFLQKWRSGAANVKQEPASVDERLPPVTPAARRVQLLASTTPAYTPASVMFRRIQQ